MNYGKQMINNSSLLRSFMACIVLFFLHSRLIPKTLPTLLFLHLGMDYQGGGTGGGGGGGGGGGYTNNFGGGGGGTQDSTEKKSRKNYDEQTLIPVTISMIKKAQTDSSGGDGTVVLEDGRPLHMVTIVGAVRSVDAQSTSIQYVIEDGTGSIDVKQWVDDNDSEVVAEEKKRAAQDNIYVKVTGSVKDYEDKKMFLANSVRKLGSGNELTHHLLDVMYSGEKFKRADSIVPPVMLNNSMGFNSNNNNSGGQANMGGGGGGFNQGGGDDKRSQVMNVMQRLNNDGEEGTSVQQCVAELPGLSEADVRDVINLLSEEGSLYSTTDENHFKLAM
jgi:replication factor A2